MTDTAQGAAIESAIAPHLLDSHRRPKHEPGTYRPPYPSFSARYDRSVESVVMAFYGVQSRDADDGGVRAALDEFRRWATMPDGPANWDRARYRDAEGYTTTINCAYWSDLAAFGRWQERVGAGWIDPERRRDGVGFFLELVTPSAERFETIFSSPAEAVGVAGAGTGFSGEIEEHAYWGSMRDRLPLAQVDALWPGEGIRSEGDDGGVRVVRLARNACLIRSGQDYTDTVGEERTMYLETVEPSLRSGMDYLRDAGDEVGCYDNRYLVVLDDDDQPTDRTFGMSWWRGIAELEDWAASHESHLRIFGAAMRHLSTFGPATRLRLYHEVSVPDEDQQIFTYVGCHPRTGMLRAIS